VCHFLTGAWAACAGALKAQAEAYSGTAKSVTHTLMVFQLVQLINRITHY
jgi:hypothetical protein